MLIGVWGLLCVGLLFVVYVFVCCVLCVVYSMLFNACYVFCEFVVCGVISGMWIVSCCLVFVVG